MRTHTRLAGVALAGGFVALSSGCLVSAHNHVSTSGVEVSDATLEQIEIGVTTEAWLVAAAGEPSSRRLVSEQPYTEILVYDHCSVEDSHATVFLLFHGHDKDVYTSRTSFEVTDGIVTKWWTQRG